MWLDHRPEVDRWLDSVAKRATTSNLAPSRNTVRFFELDSANDARDQSAAISVTPRALYRAPKVEYHIPMLECQGYQGKIGVLVECPTSQGLLTIVFLGFGGSSMFDPGDRRHHCIELPHLHELQLF